MQETQAACPRYGLCSAHVLAPLTLIEWVAQHASGSSMAIILALLLILILLACWLLTLLGLPGNWLMVAATAIYAHIVPVSSPAALGWKVVVALLVLAAGGEIVELAAGAMGVARAGGSRRGAVLAMVGSIIGGILGVFIGVPVPLIGPIVAAVLFAGLGDDRGRPWRGLDRARAGQKLADRKTGLLGTAGGYAGQDAARSRDGGRRRGSPAAVAC